MPRFNCFSRRGEPSKEAEENVVVNARPVQQRQRRPTPATPTSPSTELLPQPSFESLVESIRTSYQSLLESTEHLSEEDVYRTTETVQEQQNEAMSDDAPPPYTEFPSPDALEMLLQTFNQSPRGSSREITAQSPRSNPPHTWDLSFPILTEYAEKDAAMRRSQLQWCLVEVIAVTFSPDHCQRLQKALMKASPDWSCLAKAENIASITSSTGRALVAEMSNLIRYLKEEISNHRWLLVHDQHKVLIEKIVLEPVRHFGLDLDYVLEVLGRYKRVEGCTRPESTLVDHWMSLSLSRTDLGDSIASHASLIRRFILKREVRVVLEDYIASFQLARGLGGLNTSRVLQEESFLYIKPRRCRPRSQSYKTLSRGLRSLRESGGDEPYRSNRVRVRIGRGVREG